MADSSNTTPLPSANPNRFEEALQRYLDARRRVQATSDDDDREVDHLVAGLISDLRAKAEILWGSAADTPSLADLGEFMNDLVRLTGGAPSRVFDCARWLDRFQNRGGAWTVRGDDVFLMMAPDNAKLRDLFAELAAAGGRPQVEAELRRRHAERELVEAVN
jgi:hypothetical protein